MLLRGHCCYPLLHYSFQKKYFFHREPREEEEVDGRR